MKKKVLMSVIALFLFVMGVASGATIWGTYKGNEIIRLTVNGTTVKVTDVPAINYNNRTMIPIYLLQQAGISYTWDQKTKTVNIVTSKSSGGTSNVTNNNQQVSAKYPLYLYSYDGKTYLGELTTDKYGTESIFNQYGTYGSKYSATSIWNEYGVYGSKYSNTSAFNEYATEPPVIYENNKAIAYLTINTTLSPALSPVTLYQALEDNGY
jgi:hypothetical protein